MKQIASLLLIACLLQSCNKWANHTPEKENIKITVLKKFVTDKIVRTDSSYVNFHEEDKPRSLHNKFIVLEVLYENMLEEPIGFPETIIFIKNKGKKNYRELRKRMWGRGKWADINGFKEDDHTLPILGTSVRYLVYEVPKLMDGEVYFIPIYVCTLCDPPNPEELDYFYKIPLGKLSELQKFDVYPPQ